MIISTHISELSDLTNGQTIRIDFIHVKKSLVILRALNHKLRQQMLKLINEKQKVTVTEIFETLRMEQSVVSQHLAIMRTAGILTTSRKGKYIHYSIKYSRLAEINTFVEELVG